VAEVVRFHDTTVISRSASCPFPIILKSRSVFERSCTGVVRTPASRQELEYGARTQNNRKKE
jgi:hypothetical protein